MQTSSEFISLYDTEMAPVAAIVGGVLAQEIIKVLSAKELPIQNWFYYNGLDGKRKRERKKLIIVCGT